MSDNVPAKPNAQANTNAQANEEEEELVGRDEFGNYKLHTPTSEMKTAFDLRTEEDEKADQENQVISMYGKQNQHWDQAGKTIGVVGAVVYAANADV